MLPSHLKELITQFTALPGIGPRQAARFAFHLLRNENDISSLSSALDSVAKSIRLCRNCYIPAYSPNDEKDAICVICSNPNRNKNIVCVVEKETDALNFEKSRYFQGHYYILGGFINPIDETGLSKARVSILLNRVRNRQYKNSVEFILALSPRREGDFTCSYIESKLKESANPEDTIKITRLGRGLSTGSELEYADQETLRNALEGRR
ncbi:MAG: recombination protein RecR [Candidatus Spechtbacteria bacterium RIFCSPHIGHO2_02_FULL_43_15b]|uniref:Recombination protein RecR n=1 Tax=Candidatus Spechtbacteria bacterium RIFCSPHIGHO2_01_FULL_43_30 TaxID=1802158 RepID=A0A1G2H514_9BACT|nr:MAG: recombination protein RecR [Candidatus Spechtbacteria bacterium RIFCSPHIGHO2_01_FULL_43_30]OGZ59835.1 MAG: recombination protein RecR [Candidatus Spechtbacteria bacterium RIFCSPHIGHO2_02_FULL_43_15b]